MLTWSAHRYECRAYGEHVVSPNNTFNRMYSDTFSSEHGGLKGLPLAPRHQLPLFTAIAAHTQEAVFITMSEDYRVLSSKILYANRACRGLSGYSEQELVGRTVNTLFREGPSPYPLEYLQTILRDEEPVRAAFHGYRKDNTSYVAHLSIIPVSDVVPGVVFLIWIHHPSTPESSTKPEQAKDLQDLKTMFLSMVSHEFRAPLVGILGYAEIIRHESTDPIRAFAQHIEHYGKRLLHTLQDLLDLAQLMSNELPVHIERLDIIPTTAAVVRSYGPAARESNLHLSVDAPTSPLYASIDPRLWQRVLSNVLANAIKFTRSGSVQVTILEQDDQIQVTVTDTGIGMQPPFLDQAFDAFTQASVGTTRTHEGLGIGLAVVQKMVALMQGTIEITSSLDEGSTVTIHLPAAELPPGTPSAL